MPVRIVQSKQNARFKQLRRSLANPGQDRLTAIEGPILIAEAVRAGLRIDCLFAAQEAERLLATLPPLPEVETLLAPRALLDAVLTTENPQPVAALIEPTRWTWDQLLAAHPGRAPLLLVFAALQDPGNLGTILRSAEAFGATGIVSLPGTVNEWNPKALRASAGSVFRLPLVHCSSDECLGRLRQTGVKLLAGTARQAQPANLVDLTQPAALIIGNEGSGIQPELEEHADGAITIPCPGPVESLNAAVAASVLLYEASRQRAAKGSAR